MVAAAVRHTQRVRHVSRHAHTHLVALTSRVRFRHQAHHIVTRHRVLQVRHRAAIVQVAVPILVQASLAEVIHLVEEATHRVVVVHQAVEAAIHLVAVAQEVADAKRELKVERS